MGGTTYMPVSETIPVVALTETLLIVAPPVRRVRTKLGYSISVSRQGENVKYRSSISKRWSSISGDRGFHGQDGGTAVKIKMG